MKNVSLSLFVLVVSITSIILSCQKGGDNPTPGSTGNLITGNPAITGIPGVTIVKNSDGSTFSITVPAGTDVKSLKMTIPTQAGASINPDPSVARDYTNPVQYVITGADGSRQTVTVKVEVQQGAKSAAKQITGFSFAALNPAVTATIDEATHKITASVPPGTDITKLVPTIVVSDKATVSPATGVVQNFTNPVNYTVKAEDGSTQVYEVKVNKAVIGSDKACLLTHYESISIAKSGVQEKFILNFSYDQAGRINVIERISELGERINWVCKYNPSGDIIEVNKTNDSEKYLMTYQNNRVSKLEYFNKKNNSTDDLIGLGVYKFNDKNEIIEIDFLNEVIKFNYLNRNIIKASFYNKEKNDTRIINYDYDNKNSPLYASNPPSILTFILSRIFSGFTNNPIGKKMEGELNLKEVSYIYNSNNYPLEMKGLNEDGEPVSAKYTYSNCP